MATISNILNLVACGAAAVLGTGTNGCRPFFKKVSSIWLLPSGTVFDSSETLNLAYVQTLQAQGNLIILKGIENFADNTPDSVTEEFESGIKKHVRKAKYEFLAQFSKGMYFNAALDYLNSDGSYDAILVDIEGNILGTQSTSGSIKGFSLGMLQKTKLTWATDSTAQREGLMFQMTVPNEFDRDYVYIQNSQLDFNPETLDGINEIVLTLSTPSDADTNVTIVAKRKQDSGAFTGAAFGNFLVTTGGATTNPTGGDDSALAGTYILTGITAIATGNVVTARLYDNANNRSIINLATTLYKSNTVTETATA
jgi:hypothetical protein